MIHQFPALLAALSLSIYWFWVVVKLVRLSRKIGKDPNALPRERVGQFMRLLWYPCITLQLIALWTAAIVSPEHLKGQPGLWLGRILEPAPWWWAFATLASLICITATALTFLCWRKMGRSWRIGIDPSEKLDLVSTGPYRFVRHPIYSLRLVINTCACLMAPTPLVLLTCGIDALLLQIEARREEAYMESKHGADYQRYKKSVGRFVPRAFVV